MAQVDIKRAAMMNAASEGISPGGPGGLTDAIGISRIGETLHFSGFRDPQKAKVAGEVALPRPSFGRKPRRLSSRFREVQQESRGSVITVCMRTGNIIGYY